LAGGSALERLLQQATSGTGDFGTAQNVYQGFADLGQFNPDDPKWGYSAFNKALAKAGSESASVLERESAITGNRFGTAIQGEKADLAENLNLQRQQRLAEIFQGSQQFAALVAQGLTGLANQTAQLAGLNIDYDDYQRQLQDKKAKDELDEFLRQRQEQLMRIGLMQDIKATPMGTYKTKDYGLAGDVLGMLGGYLGTRTANSGSTKSSQPSVTSTGSVSSSSSGSSWSSSPYSMKSGYNASKY
jgi:hypothetical protein